MADNHDDTQEKTEQATQRRLQQLREQGMVTRSRELNHWLVFVTGIIFFYWSGHFLLLEFSELFGSNFQLSRNQIFQSDFVVLQLQSVFKQYAVLFFPLGLTVFLFLLLSHWLVGGWVFSFQAIAPKLERISPLAGLKRIFSIKGLTELVKSILKVLLIVGFTAGFFMTFYQDGLRLFDMEAKFAITQSLHLLWLSAVILLIPLTIVTAIDVPLQLWQHAKKFMMSKFEIKEESKETEGKPEVKQKIRQLQQRLASARMMENIPKADVIITNPDHYAVALQYDKKSMGAPVLLAKGLDLVAEKIKSIAAENDIPFVAAPPLARALYYGTDIGQEIPRGLYVAVAQVLAYVYQMEMYMRGRSQKPTLPKEWDIPPELRR